MDMFNTDSGFANADGWVKPPNVDLGTLPIVPYELLCTQKGEAEAANNDIRNMNSFTQRLGAELKQIDFGSLMGNSNSDASYNVVLPAANAGADNATGNKFSKNMLIAALVGGGFLIIVGVIVAKSIKKSGAAPSMVAA